MTLRALPLVAWLALLAGCDNGQTGSIGAGQEEPAPGLQPPCGVRSERSLDLAERVVFQNGAEITVLELQDALSPVLGQPMMLDWAGLEVSPGDNPAPLTLSGFELSAARVEEELRGSTLCGERTLIATAAFRLRTEDGLFEAEVSGSLTLGNLWIAGAAWTEGSLVFDGTARVRIAPALRERLSIAKDVPLDEWQVRLSFTPAPEWSLGPLQVNGELLSPPSTLQGLFRSLWKTQDYPAPAALAATCEAAEATSVRSFADQSEFVAALSKRWARCAGRANFEPDHDGIEITNGQTWRHLSASDGAFVEQLGFDHEGVVELGEGYAPGAYHMAFRYTSGHGLTRGLSQSGNTLRIATEEGRRFGEPEIQAPAISEFTYVAVDLPVTSAEPPYAAGTRAGAAACQGPQANIRQQFASEDELRALLLGTWSFCGERRLHTHVPATAIAFEAGDRYRYLDATGQSLLEGDFEIVASSSLSASGFTVTLITEPATFYPWIADAPRMLWAGDGNYTLLSAEP